MRPLGYLTETTPDGRVVNEWDTLTCVHCNSFWRIKKDDPKTAGGWCNRCMKPICWLCAGNGTCAPFERALERVEARDRLRKAAGV